MIALLVFIYFTSGTPFWQSFFSNFLATLLGAIVGIPTAIWLSNLQHKKDDDAQRSRIVPVLQEELLVNMTQLSRLYESGFRKFETVYAGIFLEDDAWQAFTSNGELAFINDPNLLKKLSHAYNSVRVVQRLCERYIELANLTDPKDRQYLQNIIEPLLTKGVSVAIEDIETAFRAI